MWSILRNRTVMTLTTADIAETLGISIFNIILLTYAKTFSNPNIMVSIVSVATVLPGTLGYLSGRMADTSKNKSRALILSKLVQAFMYLVLSSIITQKTAYIFLIVVAINIASDFLSIYSSDLRLPIIKEKVEDESRQQVLGLTQSVTTLLQPIGQTVGVVIIETTHDYALAGLINAITFLVAAVILFFGRKSIATAEMVVQEVEKKEKGPSILKRVLKILGESAGINVTRLLITLVIFNAVGASFDAIVNLFLLDHENISPFPFSVEILIVNLLFVFGMVLGSLLQLKIVDALSVKATMMIAMITIVVIYINFLSLANFYVLAILAFVMAFWMAKVNPKLSAQIIKMADEDLVGTISGTLGSVTSIAVPVGSIGIVLVYNALSPALAYYLSLALTFICIVTLLGDKPIKQTNE